jgi:CRP/FNR family transcriptional regulator
MAGLLQMFDTDAFDHPLAAHMPVLLRRVHAGDSLVHEGATADAIFFVRSGTFKVFRTDEDGYEQVLAFAVRSEVLGFDALCMASYPAAMQALEDSTVYVIPRREIAQLSQALPSFSLALQHAGSLTLIRSRELVDILAAVASDVRLARFLIQLSKRMAGCGQSPRRFLLRMGRREIASLLGVAHETVSRCFSALAAMGLLHVNDREIEILDMSGLKVFSRSTRRQTDDAARPHHPGLLRQATRQHTPRHARAA